MASPRPIRKRIEWTTYLCGILFFKQLKVIFYGFCYIFGLAFLLNNIVDFICHLWRLGIRYFHYHLVLRIWIILPVHYDIRPRLVAILHFKIVLVKPIWKSLLDLVNVMLHGQFWNLVDVFYKGLKRQIIPKLIQELIIWFYDYALLGSTKCYLLI